MTQEAQHGHDHGTAGYHYKPMTQEAQESAIVIYTHPDCNFSTEAVTSMTADGIAFKEIDISKVFGAFKELEKLTNGERITPVIVENGQVTIGWNGFG